VHEWRNADVFSELERDVLAYAEAVTDSAQEVDDVLFERVGRRFSPEQLVELTAWICLENFYSKFNRAFRVEAQGFCHVP
jgi:alkylhydroperoxidase family enzyme